MWNEELRTGTGTQEPGQAPPQTVEPVPSVPPVSVLVTVIQCAAITQVNRLKGFRG